MYFIEYINNEPKNDISKQFAQPKIIPAWGDNATDTPIKNPSTKQSKVTGITKPAGNLSPITVNGNSRVRRFHFCATVATYEQLMINVLNFDFFGM